MESDAFSAIRDDMLLEGWGGDGKDLRCERYNAAQGKPGDRTLLLLSKKLALYS
jgi:hypothetical protein